MHAKYLHSAGNALELCPGKYGWQHVRFESGQSIPVAPPQPPLDIEKSILIPHLTSPRYRKIYTCTHAHLRSSQGCMLGLIGSGIPFLISIYFSKKKWGGEPDYPPTKIKLSKPKGPPQLVQDLPRVLSFHTYLPKREWRENKPKGGGGGEENVLP